MRASIYVSAVLIGATLAAGAYVLNHGTSATPAGLEPAMEEIPFNADQLVAAGFESDTMSAFERRHALIMSLPAEGGVRKHRRPVLAIPPMVEYPDAAERDMYKQTARERIDVAMDQYVHGSAGR